MAQPERRSQVRLYGNPSLDVIGTSGNYQQPNMKSSSPGGLELQTIDLAQIGYQAGIGQGHWQQTSQKGALREVGGMAQAIAGAVTNRRLHGLKRGAGKIFNDLLVVVFVAHAQAESGTRAICS